jgi:hypothetical protein
MQWRSHLDEYNLHVISFIKLYSKFQLQYVKVE